MVVWAVGFMVVPVAVRSDGITITREGFLDSKMVRFLTEDDLEGGEKTFSTSLMSLV